MNKVGLVSHWYVYASNDVQPSLVTKGIASVRSPVRNLQQYNPSVTHEAFVAAVIDAFREEYDIQEEASSNY